MLYWEHIIFSSESTNNDGQVNKSLKLTLIYISNSLQSLNVSVVLIFAASIILMIRKRMASPFQFRLIAI
jgi:hypothetical protein